MLNHVIVIFFNYQEHDWKFFKFNARDFLVYADATYHILISVPSEFNSSYRDTNMNFSAYLRTLLLPKNGQGRTSGFTICAFKIKLFSLHHDIPTYEKLCDLPTNSSIRKHKYLVSFIPMYLISH
jgi:hypothetical protein